MWTQNFRLSQDDQLVDTDKLSMNMYVSDIGLPTAHQHAAAGFRITHREQLRVLKEILSQVAVPKLQPVASDTSVVDSDSVARLDMNAFKQHAHQTVHEVHRRLSDRVTPDFNSHMAIVDACLMRALDHPAVEFWLSRLFHRDKPTSNHCCHVAIYSMLTGLNSGYPVHAIETLGVAGILHDLGKLFIEQDILQKPERLTDSEFHQVRAHSHWGYSLLCQDTRIPDGVIAAVLQHHERIDGAGYPAQLRGDEIHIFAKIVAIADAFDAMTTQRPYNKIKEIDEALTTIEQHAGSQFDVAVVKKFVGLLRTA